MNGDEILRMVPGEIIRPDGLRAGWDGFGVLHLDGAEVTELDPTFEHGLYVIRGAGEAIVGSANVELHAGTALTLVRGTGATVTADEDGLEVFLITVRT
jgi:hypothetical protein